MTILASVIGQSNEVGSGIRAACSTIGTPLRDPVAPNGGTSRSMWPMVADALGRSGVGFCMHNTAVGGTSLVYSWVGCVNLWQTGVSVARGLYVQSGGGLWRCNAAAGAVPTTTVAPTGTADTTGADSVPWIYLGVPGAGDAVGTIYASGSARFDPNGYIATAMARLALVGQFDARVLMVSIGQGDKTLGSTLEQYVTALQRVVDLATAAGRMVAIGGTCSSATAGSEAYYQSVLIPARNEALARNRQNPLVFAGPDLYTLMGVLPVSPTSGPGLQSDQLHMNDAALDIAAEHWARALLPVAQ